MLDPEVAVGRLLTTLGRVRRRQAVVNIKAYARHVERPLTNRQFQWTGRPNGHSQLPLAELGKPSPNICLLYTSPSPRDRTRSRMPSSA